MTRPGELARAFACLAVLAAAAPARAQEVEFYATLNAPQVQLGDTVTLTVQLSTGQQDASGDIHAPTMPDVEILTQHTSSSMRMSFGGGNASVVRSRVFTLVLQPKHTGTVSIPPFTVEVHGQPYKTAELSLKVVPADPNARRQPQRQQPPPDPMQQFFGGNPFQGMPGDDDADPFAQLFGGNQAPPKEGDIFLRASLDKKEAWLGEQLTLSLYLFSRVDVARVDNPKLPKLDAFWAEDIDSPQNLTESTRMVNGQLYRVYLLKRRALFPLKAGKQVVDPVEVDVATGLSLFGGGHTVHRASQSVEVEVKPLPAGAPPGFAASDVGQWRLALGSNPPGNGPVAATVGQPVTLDLVLDGLGNLRNVTTPKLPAVRGLHVYDPTTTDKVSVTKGRFGGRRTIEFVVMPEQTGTITIPPVTFGYFDPQSATYQTASTQPLTLAVGAGANGTASIAPGSSANNPAAGQNVLGANLARPIHPRATIGEGQKPLWAQAFFLPALLLPFGLLLGEGTYRSMKQRAGRDDPRARVRSASSRARKRFKQADALLETGDAGAYYGAVAKALGDYLTDKTGFAAHGLTRDERARRVAGAGAKPESVEQVRAVLDACDLGRFAPGSAQGRRDVLEQAVAAVDALESQKLARTAGSEG